jgi:hypothetical protein
MKRFGLALLTLALVSASLFANGTQATGTTATTDGLTILRVWAADGQSMNGGVTHTFSDFVSGRAKSPLYDKFVDDLAKLGIKLEYTFVQGDQWETAFQTLLVSGQLNNYDLVSASISAATMQGMLSQNRMAPLDQLIAQYSTGAAKGFYNSSVGKQTAGLFTQEDGHWYWMDSLKAYYYKDPTVLNGGMFQVGFIRQDWLDRLRLPMPTTLDEVYNTLLAFQLNDVNQSGLRDEVADIALNELRDNMGGFNNAVAGWFGLANYTDNWIGLDSNHKVVSPWYQSQIKDYITWLNTLYKAGLLREGTGGNELSSNKVGFMSNWIAESWEEPGMQTPDGAPKAYLSSFFIKVNNDSAIWKEPSIGGEGSTFFIPSGTKNQVAIGKLLDLLYSREHMYNILYGIEGYNYTMDANGAPVFKREADAKNDIEKWDFEVMAKGGWQFNMPRVRVGYAEQNGKPVIGVDKSEELKATIAFGEGLGYTEPLKYQFGEKAFAGVYPIRDGIAGYLAPATAAQQERMNALVPDLNTYGSELLTALIRGTQSIDRWDSYIANLKRLGLDELLSIYQVRFDRAAGAR